MAYRCHREQHPDLTMARIPDETREAIETDLRAGELSVRAIATAHGVSPAFVSGQARQLGIEPGARSQTEKATAAAQIDTKALKATMAKGSMTMAQTVLDSFDGVDWDSVSPYSRALIFGILVDKAADLTRDESEGFAAVDGWLRSVVGTTT